MLPVFFKGSEVIHMKDLDEDKIDDNWISKEEVILH